MRKVTYENGVIVEIVDDRTLEGAKLDLIYMIREKCGEDILAAYPAYKQSNAALGLLSPEETQAIKDGIQALRNECNAKEAAINACTTLEELDAL